MAQASATQNVQSLLSSLNAALLKKHSLEVELKQADEQILAFRNMLAGIELGKQLQQEVHAEQARDRVASHQEAPTHE